MSFRFNTLTIFFFELLIPCVSEYFFAEKRLLLLPLNRSVKKLDGKWGGVYFLLGILSKSSWMMRIFSILWESWSWIKVLWCCFLFLLYVAQIRNHIEISSFAFPFFACVFSLGSFCEFWLIIKISWFDAVFLCRRRLDFFAFDEWKMGFAA